MSTNYTDRAEDARVFMLGAGAAGGSLAVALFQKNTNITGVYDIDGSRAAHLAEQVEAPAHQGQLPAAMADADIVIIAVPDPLIGPTATRVAASHCCSSEQVWLHLAGSLSAQVLSPLDGLVAGRGTFHPALVFAPGTISAIPPGARFATDGDGEALRITERLATLLEGRTVAVGEADRPTYHAAMVMASNYLVTVLSQARSILSHTEIPADDVEPTLLSLAQSALKRSTEIGLDRALSGPIRRGDAQTVAHHLNALTTAPQARELYRQLGLATASLARGLPGLSDGDLEAIIRLLTEQTEPGN